MKNMTPDEIRSALVDLYAAKTSGVARVRDKDGKEVQYRSMAEIDGIIASLEGMLGQRQRVSLVQHGRD